MDQLSHHGMLRAFLCHLLVLYISVLILFVHFEKKKSFFLFVCSNSWFSLVVLLLVNQLMYGFVSFGTFDFYLLFTIDLGSCCSIYPDNGFVVDFASASRWFLHYNVVVVSSLPVVIW